MIFQTATTTSNRVIGNITIEFEYTSKSSIYNNNNRLVNDNTINFSFCSSSSLELNQIYPINQKWKQFLGFLENVKITLEFCLSYPICCFCCCCLLYLFIVSTTMDNSMGQIVPMTSLALSQSMDSVNTATNEEEVCSKMLNTFDFDVIR